MDVWDSGKVSLILGDKDSFAILLDRLYLDVKPTKADLSVLKELVKENLLPRNRGNS